MLPSVQQRHRPPQSMPISGIDCFSDRVIQQWFIGRACSAVLMLLQFVVFLVAMSCPVVLLPCFAMRTRAPRLGLRSYRDRIPLPYQRCGGNCPRPEAQGRVHQIQCTQRSQKPKARLPTQHSSPCSRNSGATWGRPSYLRGMMSEQSYVLPQARLSHIFPKQASSR